MKNNATPILSMKKVNSMMKASQSSTTNQVLLECATEMITPIQMNVNSTLQQVDHLLIWIIKTLYLAE